MLAKFNKISTFKDSKGIKYISVGKFLQETGLDSLPIGKVICNMFIKEKFEDFDEESVIEKRIDFTIFVQTMSTILHSQK
jgi:hypothetical protein